MGFLSQVKKKLFVYCASFIGLMWLNYLACNQPNLCFVHGLNAFLYDRNGHLDYDRLILN